jgi:hypothetical protein
MKQKKIKGIFAIGMMVISAAFITSCVPTTPPESVPATVQLVQGTYKGYNNPNFLTDTTAASDELVLTLNANGTFTRSYNFVTPTSVIPQTSENYSGTWTLNGNTVVCAKGISGDTTSTVINMDWTKYGTQAPKIKYKVPGGLAALTPWAVGAGCTATFKLVKQ